MTKTDRDELGNRLVEAMLALFLECSYVILTVAMGGTTRSRLASGLIACCVAREFMRDCMNSRVDVEFYAGHEFYRARFTTEGSSVTLGLELRRDGEWIPVS